MKTYQYIIISAILCGLAFTPRPTKACDVCGCSLGGNYFGILPQFYNSFIGLRYSRAHFSAEMNHDSEYLGHEYSNDTYNKVELWGRFYAGEKVQIFGFIPYSFNDMNGTEQKVKAHGLGDITLMANYSLINTGEDMTKDWRHTWLVGGGVKLPTGKFNQEDKSKLINPNFQLGTGSVDFLMTTVYTIRYKKVGLNTELAYKINTMNSKDYRFGNQFNTSTQLFFWYQTGVFSFLPNAGLYFEQAQKHKQADIIQVNTGGNALFGSVGLDVYFQQFSLGFNYKEPFYQHMNSDNIADITSRERVTVSLTYNF